MTTFGPKQPGAVRCNDCLHCQTIGRSFRCNAIADTTIGKGYWRKCSSYQARQSKPSLASKPSQPLFTMPAYQIDGKNFSVFCDDGWIVNDSGAEPVWSFADEEMAVELFRRWMRMRRAEFERQCEITRRRSAMRTVKP